MTGVETGQIVVGEVTSLDDKKKLGRVKVEMPAPGGRRERLVSRGHDDGGPRTRLRLPPRGPRPCAGRDLVFGDPNQAYVLGAVWSDKQQPPKDDGKPVENNLEVPPARDRATRSASMTPRARSGSRWWTRTTGPKDRSCDQFEGRQDPGDLRQG